MGDQDMHISNSIEVLNNNLIEVAQVREWANLMGYQNPKKFSRRFLRYYAVRPCKILVAIRLESIYKQLQTRNYSNFQVARQHSLPDEKALNKFVNYHFGCCPSELQRIPEEEFQAGLEKFGSKIEE